MQKQMQGLFCRPVNYFCLLYQQECNALEVIASCMVAIIWLEPKVCHSRLTAFVDNREQLRHFLAPHEINHTTRIFLWICIGKRGL